MIIGLILWPSTSLNGRAFRRASRSPPPLLSRLTPYSANPAVGVTVRQSETAGTRKLPYSDQEVARLLALADQETLTYRRWLPWLMAPSGARVGELAQLWGQRIVEVDGMLS